MTPLVIDADAHFMEPWDWLDEHFPRLARRLPKFDVNEVLLSSVVGEAFAALPADKAPTLKDVWPPHLHGFLDMIGTGRKSGTEVARIVDQADEQFGGKLRKVWKAPGARGGAERARLMEQCAIDVQFINTTMGYLPAELARNEVGDAALERQCLEAYNAWAAQSVHGYENRQIPVTYVTLDDLDWTINELTRMRKLGSRAFCFTAKPHGGRSLAHPDFDRLWSAAEDLGMAVIFHVAYSGRPCMEPEWANTGRDWRVALMTFETQVCQVPMVALTAMIYGGVFERHPKLFVMSQELEIGWVPYWMERLDGAVRTFHGTPVYDLPLKPSEYMRRNVFVSGLPPSNKLRPLLDLVPDGIVVFASDWPHPEGGPIEASKSKWLEQISDLPQARIDAFMGCALADAMDIHL